MTADHAHTTPPNTDQPEEENTAVSLLSAASDDLVAMRRPSGPPTFAWLVDLLYDVALDAGIGDGNQHVLVDEALGLLAGHLLASSSTQQLRRVERNHRIVLEARVARLTHWELVQALLDAADRFAALTPERS